jgi:hypothetical protein
MSFKPVPEVGKTYNCFDDGKIRESRRYELTVKKVIPFAEIDMATKCYWIEQVADTDWLLAQKTDFFIISESSQPGMEECEISVRDIYGGWFGIGDWFGMGRLDVEGKLWESYQNG